MGSAVISKVTAVSACNHIYVNYFQSGSVVLHWRTHCRRSLGTWFIRSRPVADKVAIHEAIHSKIIN